MGSDICKTIAVQDLSVDPSITKRIDSAYLFAE